VAAEVGDAARAQLVKEPLDAGEVLFPHGERRLFEEGAVAFGADTQVLLGHVALGDLALVSLHADLAAGVVENRTPRCGDPLDATVLGHQAVLLLVEGSALEELVPVIEHTLAVLGMYPADELCVLEVGG